MPSKTDAPRTPSANKKRIGVLVAEAVKVLDRPVAADTPPPGTLERDGVRSKLRLNRASGLLPLGSIRPDPTQPRTVDTKSDEFRDLVASVRDHGVINPISVRHVEDGDFFQIIAGERRYRASREAGLTEIPAIVKGHDNTQVAIEQIEENLHRKNLNPLEEAAAIRRLMAATDESQEQVARRIHKSKSYVSKVLAIDAQLTRQEKTSLMQVSGGNAPGISLIYTALGAKRPEIRAAILSGRLRGDEVDKQAKADGRGRPKSYAAHIVVDEMGATVTVRFPKKVSVSPEKVLDALSEARARFKHETEVL